jgi:hypothetical protein
MRFKTTIDTNSIFFMLLIVLIPGFLALQALESGVMWRFILFAVIAGLALIAIIIDIFGAVYIFTDDTLIFTAIIGREKIAYSQIQSYGTRIHKGKQEIYLGVGRRYAHKVRAKDKEGFLAELLRVRPDLPEER